MKEKLNTLDHVRIRKFDGIASETTSLNHCLKFDRSQVLNVVDKFRANSGAHFAISEIMGLLWNYLSICSYIEGLKDRDDCTVNTFDPIDYLPTFEELSGTVFALKELFTFLGDVEDPSIRADRAESSLQLIQAMGAQSISGVPMDEYLRVCKDLTDSYATIAETQTK